MKDLVYRQQGRDPYYKIWHTSEKNMLLYVHSGKGSIVFREKSLPLEAGMLCFIGGERYHYTFPECFESYERSKLFLDTAKTEGLLHLCSDSAAFKATFDKHAFCIAYPSPEDCRRIEHLLDALHQSKEEGETALCGAVLLLTSLLFRGATDKDSPPVGKLQRAVEYINAHITEPLTVERICAAVYVSKYHFCRSFKREIGLTVMEYVLQTRIAMAKELLRDKTLSITKIASTCGFCGISYFSKAFKKETGLSPRQYRGGLE